MDIYSNLSLEDLLNITSNSDTSAAVLTKLSSDEDETVRGVAKQYSKKST